ncbi:dihydroxyacetone kinase subunit DhaK [Vibrio sp. DW001]|uniref:dihydroxyacetone kinase subunit DhaK n=1 Tax=Vibrio sp. DW001 TaxID=2912315 RepID=UPI0023AF63BD|nr:dihydroxyacetone kinase subunit DhaK [Vibrio sp. DW001]WED28762.1 dihydroxyacetone kinase subunit DhaK [Vibrio sp. DW001]
MRKPKKLINKAADVAREQFDGYLYAGKDILQRVGNLTAAIRKDVSAEKVMIVTGGGAGHEPMYGGYVGQGFADAVVVGDVFAAPTPDVIVDTTTALNPKQGVLFIYGNYAGDNMNFDIASELLEDDDIKVHTIRVNDDVISASADNKIERRGIAGSVFVLKIAGAVAECSSDFDHIVEVSELALKNTSSIGVALGPCAIPQNDSFNFEIPHDEIEVGMGLHGEPGVGKSKIVDSQSVVITMLNMLCVEQDLQAGDSVCVLVNNLGSATQMELLIANKTIAEQLGNQGIEIHDTLLGSYCTSLEMSGFSITLLKLNDQLKELYDMPCHALALRK